MEKKIIHTKDAPAPIGPYSQAVRAGNMLFISGQIALNPVTNELVMENITSETEQVMNNLKAILEEAGSGFAQVVKSGIFLSSMDHFGIVNEVYARFITEPYPARETVAVKGLPRNVNVEISMIAIIPA